ncbi:hypothetical protein [Campylobacter sp. RM16192]|uniref:hypothetical protein n=1 Tax=Campylobacter sp. RM16192 TaxID=1660080 RepID=UPI00159B4C59|nr:hypothetical protein [Campylobacter sp. RM16192]QKU36232.1 hypothetical protein CDOMC_a019 [Campylobacter sp. RM16192]
MITSNLNYSRQILTAQNSAISPLNSVATKSTDLNFDSALAAKENSSSIYTNFTKFGFKADDKGFLEPDFNQAAGIPKAVKIHVKTLEQISQYANKTNSGYSPVEAMSKAWNFFSKLVRNQEYLSGERLLGKDDLKTMPISYNSTGSILGDLISVQYGLDESIAASQANQISPMTNDELDNGYTAVNFSGLARNYSNEYFDSAKKIKDDNKTTMGDAFGDEPSHQVSIAQMFAHFIRTDTFEWDYDGNRTQRVKAYYDFLKSGKSIQDFLGADRLANLRAEYTKEVSLEKMDLANKMFDEFLESLNKLNREFYQKHQALIDNYDFTKTFEKKAKVEFPIGRSLNLNI